MVRLWPGMDSSARPRRCSSAPPPRSGGPWSGCRAAGPATPATSPPSIPLTVDGLGPRGGAAHNPEEYIVADSLDSRAAVALALASAALDLSR